MKALHVLSGDLWAGAEVQAYTLLTSLQKQPDTQVAAALMNDGELAERLRAQHIPVTIFPERQLNAVQILVGLRQLIRTLRPDIIHTHRTKENILGALANQFSGNVPSVRTVHGASEYSSKGIKRLLSRVNRWCGIYLQDKIIAVSSELAEKLAAQFPRNKIVTIENGVDIDTIHAQVHPTEFRTREPHATHIGIVGRLVPVKRVDLFLEMARSLREKEPTKQWRFHIFGDGPLAASLKQQAAALDVTDSVLFHGHRSDIIACIAALDILVMCSDHEGLPMTLLEARVVGTPIVAHAVGGITQLLDDVFNDRLVVEHHADAYAAAVSAIANRHPGGSNTAKPIDTRFSSITCMQKHQALYQNLCAGISHS